MCGAFVFFTFARACSVNQNQYIWPCVLDVELNPNTFLKLLLVSSILIGTFGLFALGNLDTIISGDGIPNRPQREPPIEYPWDKAVQIIAVVALSAVTAIYSGIKIFR